MKLLRVPVGLPEISALKLQQDHLSWVRTKESEWGLLRKEHFGIYRGQAYDAEVFGVIRSIPLEDDIQYVGYVAGKQVASHSDLFEAQMQVEQSIS
jgi:hypothetical protein